MVSLKAEFIHEIAEKYNSGPGNSERLGCALGSCRPAAIVCYTGFVVVLGSKPNTEERKSSEITKQKLSDGGGHSFHDSNLLPKTRGISACKFTVSQNRHRLARLSSCKTQGQQLSCVIVLISTGTTTNVFRKYFTKTKFSLSRFGPGRFFGEEYYF